MKRPYEAAWWTNHKKPRHRCPICTHLMDKAHTEAMAEDIGVDLDTAFLGLEFVDPVSFEDPVSLDELSFKLL